MQAFARFPERFFEVSRRAIISIFLLQMGKLRLGEVNEHLTVQENSRARNETKFHVVLATYFMYLHAGVQGHNSWHLRAGL